MWAIPRMISDWRRTGCKDWYSSTSRFQFQSKKNCLYTLSTYLLKYLAVIAATTPFTYYIILYIYISSLWLVLSLNLTGFHWNKNVFCSDQLSLFSIRGNINIRGYVNYHSKGTLWNQTPEQTQHNPIGSIYGVFTYTLCHYVINGHIFHRKLLGEYSHPMDPGGETHKLKHTGHHCDEKNRSQVPLLSANRRFGLWEALQQTTSMCWESGDPGSPDPYLQGGKEFPWKFGVIGTTEPWLWEKRLPSFLKVLFC